MTIPVTIEVSASTTVPIPVTLTVAERGPKGEIGLTGPAGADSIVPGPQGDPGPPGADSTVPGPKGDQGDPGPTAVSADAGQLATLGTDNLLLVSSDDVATAAQGALADSAVQPDDLTWAALTDTATDEASDGQVWTADGAGGAAWADPSGGTGERRHDYAYPYIYCGTAPAGTDESAATWALTRVTLNAEGDVTATETATDAWTDRATATYA